MGLAPAAPRGTRVAGDRSWSVGGADPRRPPAVSEPRFQFSFPLAPLVLELRPGLTRREFALWRLERGWQWGELC